MNISVVSNGRTLSRHTHNGRAYLVASKGAEYTIVLHNPTSQRQLAVVSVDGVNIVDASDAAPQGAGYVVDPGKRIEVKGWHRSNDKASHFRFGDKEISYANQTGRGTTNNGVIGVMVYNEKVTLSGFFLQNQRPWEQQRKWAELLQQQTTIISNHSGSPMSDLRHAQASYSVDSANRMRCSASAEKSMDLGTGYGREVDMRTRSVQFTAASDSPVQALELYYGTRERLLELGVVVDRPSGLPTAFPAAPHCPAPPGWSG